MISRFSSLSVRVGQKFTAALTRSQQASQKATALFQSTLSSPHAKKAQEPPKPFKGTLVAGAGSPADKPWEHPLNGSNPKVTFAPFAPKESLSGMIINIHALQASKSLFNFTTFQFEDFEAVLDAQQVIFNQDVYKLDSVEKNVNASTRQERQQLQNVVNGLQNRLAQNQLAHRQQLQDLGDYPEVQAALALQTNRAANIRKLLSDFKASLSSNEEQVASPNKESHGDIYFAFFSLMARIIRQANADAHELYEKIKLRTDQVDMLSKLKAEINNAGTGTIDWSNDPVMKNLLDEARKMGVVIPEGKYKFSEKEREALKENVQMKKDNLDKMTQIERVTLQKYMHEIGECHQARSNTLKSRKQVADTIIHNFAP